MSHRVSRVRRYFGFRLPAPSFAYGTEYLKLAAYNNSPDHSTKGTRSHLNVLSLLVSTRFQVLFHSPPGVLFTFPSRYCSSIGHQVVFRLGWWSTRLPTGFHVSGGTLDPRSSLPLSNTGLSPSAVGLPMPFFWIPRLNAGPKPRKSRKTSGLASSAFARHYWRNLG